MKVSPTNMTVADYCAAMGRSEITINREYQRSDKVWPAIAKSYLIESILLDYPIPKLSLYQKTDLKSRRTYKEIVDGQQRSSAIRDFFNDKFTLSRSLETEEIAGKKFSELDDDFKSRFLEYSLGIDLFLSATPPEVVEVFRRMNSYTIPLNPEEHRHASFQGFFKWFIANLTKRLEPVFTQVGLFSDKQLIRMADAKLVSEICDALINGITTTSKASLDRLYRSRDKNFEEQDDIDRRIYDAIEHVRQWEEIHNTSLMKPHVMYSLTLAIIHVARPVLVLQDVFAIDQPGVRDATIVQINLTTLASALETDEPDEPYGEFIRASTDRTNVKQQRETRFRWFCLALTNTLPA